MSKSGIGTERIVARGTLLRAVLPRATRAYKIVIVDSGARIDAPWPPRYRAFRKRHSSYIVHSRCSEIWQSKWPLDSFGGLWPPGGGKGAVERAGPREAARLSGIAATSGGVVAGMAFEK